MQALRLSGVNITVALDALLVKPCDCVGWLLSLAAPNTRCSAPHNRRSVPAGQVWRESMRCISLPQVRAAECVLTLSRRLACNSVSLGQEGHPGLGPRVTGPGESWSPHGTLCHSRYQREVLTCARTSGAASEGGGRGDATRCQAWCRLAPYGGTPKPPGAGYRASIGSRSGLSSAFRNCAQASAHCQLPS